MRGSLILLLLWLSAAENDCNSLLSTRAAEERHYLQEGKCLISDETEGTIQDNSVGFVPKLDKHGQRHGAFLLKVSFKPIWFVLTRGQPIEKDCVISKGPTFVNILAGRQLSEGVRDKFADGVSGNNMLCSSSDAKQIGQIYPAALNFVFDGLMTFTFANDTSPSHFSLRLRLAQGYFRQTAFPYFEGNNWWIASTDCTTTKNQAFLCDDIDGKGQVRLYPWLWSFGVSAWPM